MWAPHNGDHMGITLLKSFSYLKAEDDKFTGLEVQILVIASGSHCTTNEFFHRIDFFFAVSVEKQFNPFMHNVEEWPNIF